MRAPRRPQAGLVISSSNPASRVGSAAQLIRSCAASARQPRGRPWIARPRGRDEARGPIALTVSDATPSRPIAPGGATGLLISAGGHRVTALLRTPVASHGRVRRRDDPMTAGRIRWRRPAGHGRVQPVVRRTRYCQTEVEAMEARHATCSQVTPAQCAASTGDPGDCSASARGIGGFGDRDPRQRNAEEMSLRSGAGAESRVASMTTARKWASRPACGGAGGRYG